jgi:hypothetical protein
MKILDNRFRTPFLLLILFSLIFTANNLYAQDYNWSVILHDNTEINNVIPLEVKENYLILKTSTALTGIDIKKIVSLKKRVRASTWTYVGYGAIIGGGVYTLIKVFNLKERSSTEPYGIYMTLATILNSGAIGGIIGGVIGYLIGSTAGDDEVYDFKEISIDERLTQLDWIIKNRVN